MLYTNVPDGGFEQEQNAFDTRQSRTSFIVRVYAVLFVCLAATALQCFAVRMSHDLMQFFRGHWWIAIIFLAVYVVSYIALVCCYCTRHTFPVNLVMLILLVEAMTGMCVYATSRYQTEIVFYTFGLTAALCLLISLIAIFGPVDFTGCQFLFMILEIVTLLLGIATVITAILYPSHLLRLIYSSVAVVFLSLILAYDTQMVFGGRHNDLGQDEIIYGAVSLYTDIMQMFLHLLHLVNECF